ncbi:MAG TPA: right-handed parallel beta-helix repeat-containing protein, partial [Candidatus Paceibacterota bacterium]|nr:right-handed parallel beta-helix repeat-containing protein [Candidatus Paceibacterota bacterium]
TSTFAGGIALSGGCFQDTTGKCIGKGRDGTYIVAAYNSTNKAYADYITDFSSDNTEINTALQAAYANGRGGKVYLLEGDYLMSTGAGDKIVMATSTSLIGQGPSTRIFIASSTNANVDVIAANRTPFITIADLMIEGNSPRNSSGTQNGIVFTAVSTSTIRNVVASSTRNSAITLLTTSYGNKIVDNLLSGTGEDGIGLYSSSFGNAIIGNTSIANVWGVYLSSASNNTLSGNIIRQNSQNGITLETTSNYNTITGNSVFKSGADGIDLDNSHFNLISANNVATTTLTGITLSGFSSSNTISGNVSSGNNGGAGISLFSSYDNTISGNTTNANQHGIYMSSTLDNTVTGNIANYNTAYGLVLNAGADRTTLTGNTANVNTTAGIFVSNTDNSTITGNTVAFNGGHGILLDPGASGSSDNTIANNRILGNGGTGFFSGIYLNNGDNNLISGNHITDTSGTGYAINIQSNSTGNTLTGNIYSGTGATRIADFATSTSRYTQWDRITLANPSGAIPEITESLLGIVASTTAPLASTTQTGAGKILSLNNTVGEMFTVANSGLVGIGTSSPYAKLSVVGETVSAFYTATTTATSTFAGGLQVTTAGGLHLSNGGIRVNNLNTASCDLKSDTNGIFFCGTDAVGGGGSEVNWTYNYAGLTRVASSTSDVLIGNTSTSSLAKLEVIAGAGKPAAYFSSNVGVGTTSPWGKLSVEMDTTNPAFVVSNDASSSPSFFIGGVNQNGFVGFGTTSNLSLARIFIDNTMSQSGATFAIAGMHEMYTFNPSADNTTQVGDRLILLNNPGSSATNTAVGQIIRTIDHSSRSNKVMGLEVVSNGGSNTFGVNTGIRTTGATFGLQAITNSLAGGTSTPAAIFGENTGSTLGEVLRLYTSTMTTATSVALFFQETSAFSGDGLRMDFGKGGGSFTGNFANFRVNDTTRFLIDDMGTTTIGATGQTTNAAGLLIPYGSICVDDDGSCTGTTTGYVAAVGFLTGHTNDLAEYFHSSDALETGEIVFAKGGASVGKAATTTAPVIGVVSEKPGLALGAELNVPADSSKYPIGLAGRIPVKVSDESGQIQVGDEIVLSSISGIGMKAGTTSQGTIVGIALESFDGTEYLSPATLEVGAYMQTRLSCTTRPVTRDTMSAGGSGSEDGESSIAPASDGPETEEVCTEERVRMTEENTPAREMQIGTTSVKVGKILMFITIERRESIIPGLAIDALGSDAFGQLKLLRDMNAGGKNIFDVGSIAGISGKWHIDEDGTIVASALSARDVRATGSLEVGTEGASTGITIFDAVTHDAYCMMVASGVVATRQGKCGASSEQESSSGGSGSVAPAPVITPEPQPADTGTSTGETAPTEAPLLPASDTDSGASSPSPEPTPVSVDQTVPSTETVPQGEEPIPAEVSPVESAPASEPPASDPPPA